MLAAAPLPEIVSGFTIDLQVFAPGLVVLPPTVAGGDSAPGAGGLVDISSLTPRQGNSFIVVTPSRESEAERGAFRWNNEQKPIRDVQVKWDADGSVDDISLSDRLLQSLGTRWYNVDGDRSVNSLSFSEIPVTSPNVLSGDTSLRPFESDEIPAVRSSPTNSIVLRPAEESKPGNGHDGLSNDFDGADQRWHQFDPARPARPHTHEKSSDRQVVAGEGGFTDLAKLRSITLSTQDKPPIDPRFRWGEYSSMADQDDPVAEYSHLPVTPPSSDAVAEAAAWDLEVEPKHRVSLAFDLGEAISLNPLPVQQENDTGSLPPQPASQTAPRSAVQVGGEPLPDSVSLLEVKGPRPPKYLSLSPWLVFLSPAFVFVNDRRWHRRTRSPTTAET